MSRLRYWFVAWFTAVWAVTPAQVPSLRALGGNWLSGAQIVFPPSATNTVGALDCTENLTGFRYCAFPPVAQGGDAANLLVDGVPLAAHRYRWLPYQAEREATAPNGLRMRSATRIGPRSGEVIERIFLENPTRQIVTARLELRNETGFRRCPGVWDWSNRDVRASDGFVHRRHGSIETITDSKSGVVATIVGPPSRVRLLPSQGKTFYLSCRLGPPDLAGTDADFRDARVGWERRWRDAFTPGNATYSGNLPTLVTADAKLKRVYYLAVATLLAMERTGFPHAHRCFVTVGPEYGTTLEYFWDTALFGNVYALLDPVNYRLNLNSWLAVDIHHHYAVDYLTGKGVGPWYSPNDYSVFTAFWKYMSVTGDRAFRERNRDRFVKWAEAWKGLVHPGETLADFGDNDNLLECSPAYVNMVPSLNAAQVGMMRLAARLCPAEEAASLRADAAHLARAVLAQYVPGDGVWKTKHRDGAEVVNRHVYDYLTIGLSMTPDLSPTMKRQMTAFVDRELLANGWIRAMSLSDPFAAVSDRPDHGPKGSYAAWPAMAALTMAKFGQFRAMESLIERCEGATWQGPFPQGFELLQIPGTDQWIPRIARRGCDYNETSGAAFCETVIDGLFGVRWSESGTVAVDQPSAARPINATLRNLRTRAGLVSVKCGAFGVRLSRPASLGAQNH